MYTKKEQKKLWSGSANAKPLRRRREARRLEAARSADRSGGIGLTDFADVGKDGQTDHSGLREYLKTRDICTLEIIQAVMYIGRDHLPFMAYELFDRAKDADGIIARSVLSKQPDMLLLEWMREKVSDRDPDINKEADMIYDKLPLDMYLNRAFAILGI